MHLIHRPNRRLHKSEKFLAITVFMVLFVICIYLIALVPPTSDPSQKTEEKYYTVVLSEHEMSQLKELINTYHKELPSSIREVQSPFK
jgi:hypothetical protein